MTNTRMRGVRIPDEIWEPALAHATTQGTNLTEVIRAALAAYTEDAAPGTVTR